MKTCGQCEYYRDKQKDCPHQENTAFDEVCDKFKYTNPQTRIDYLQAEVERLEEDKAKLAETILRFDNFCRVNDIDLEQALKENP